jgi:hypothetical protein
VSGPIEPLTPYLSQRRLSFQFAIQWIRKLMADGKEHSVEEVIDIAHARRVTACAALYELETLGEVEAGKRSQRGYLYRGTAQLKKPEGMTQEQAPPREDADGIAPV